MGGSALIACMPQEDANEVVVNRKVQQYPAGFRAGQVWRHS